MLSEDDKRVMVEWMAAREAVYGVSVTLDSTLVNAIDSARFDIAEKLGMIPSRSYLLSYWLTFYADRVDADTFKDIIEQNWKPDQQ